MFNAQVRQVRPKIRSARASTGAPARLTAAPSHTSSSGRPSNPHSAPPRTPGLARRWVSHRASRPRLVGKASLAQNSGVRATSARSLRTP